MLEFSAPYNWCDRICERCPLSGQCPAAVVIGRERSNTSSLDHVVDEVLEVLAEEVARLERACGRRGNEPMEELVSARSPPDDVQRVLDAAWQLARAVVERFPGREDLAVLATLVHAKVARVLRVEPDAADSWVWRSDSVPNLMLVERVLDTLSEMGELDELVAEARTVRALLAPWLATISNETREAVRILAAAGRAPSPFAQRDAPSSR